MAENYLNELNEKLKKIDNKKNKSMKNNDNNLSTLFNDLYLSLISNIDNKEEYEYFFNIYRNEEYDIVRKNNSKKIISNLQKDLNHTFGILPLDRFNEKDLTKLEEMYDEVMDIEEVDEEEEDEDYEPTEEELLYDIQDEIVETFSKKMEKNPKLLDFFVKIDEEIKNSNENMNQDEEDMNDMKEYINKMELPEEEKTQLIDEYKKIQDYSKTLLPDDLKILKMDIPIPVKFEIFEKLESLDKNSFSGHDDNKTRDWINQVLKIPFGKYCEKPNIEDLNNFLKDFKNKLDNAIYGQDNVKESLIEITTKWLLSKSKNGHCIAIEGPPGVGKTSIIRDGLSKALKRPFCTFSLAGVSDENYLSGFSFTYEGATCGRFAKMVMESGVMNPIIFLDELDKVDTHKSLSVFNKLVEITDFSQNYEIEDYYFGNNIKFDLSQCIFIFSLNDINNVDPILRDRLEIIKVNGFNNPEKFNIAKNYLIPRELSNYNFNVNFTDENIKYIISKLSDEQGVRNLKRYIEILLRKINVLRFYNEKDMSYYVKDFAIIDNQLNMTNNFIDKLLKNNIEKVDPVILRMYM